MHQQKKDDTIIDEQKTSYDVSLIKTKILSVGIYHLLGVLPDAGRLFHSPTGR